MTGMPAFGPTHDEKALWSLVAFLRTLPETTSQEYSAMAEAAGLPERVGGHIHQHARAQSHEPAMEMEEEAPHTHGHDSRGEETGEAHQPQAHEHDQ
jgi:hypothetical protein